MSIVGERRDLNRMELCNWCREAVTIATNDNPRTIEVFCQCAKSRTVALGSWGDQGAAIRAALSYAGRLMRRRMRPFEGDTVAAERDRIASFLEYPAEKMG